MTISQIPDGLFVKNMECTMKFVITQRVTDHTVEVPDAAVDAVPARLLPHPAGQARRAQIPPPQPGQAAAELGEFRNDKLRLFVHLILRLIWAFSA